MTVSLQIDTIRALQRACIGPNFPVDFALRSCSRLSMHSRPLASVTAQRAVLGRCLRRSGQQQQAVQKIAVRAQVLLLLRCKLLVWVCSFLAGQISFFGVVELWVSCEALAGHCIQDAPVVIHSRRRLLLESLLLAVTISTAETARASVVQVSPWNAQMSFQPLLTDDTLSPGMCRLVHLRKRQQGNATPSKSLLESLAMRSLKANS